MRGTKPLVVRDWLTALRYKIVHSTEEGEKSIKTNMKEGGSVIQQKGRRFPIQLQEQVDREMNNLLKRAH